LNESGEKKAHPPSIFKTIKWTEEKDKLLLKFIDELKFDWKKISKQLFGSRKVSKKVLEDRYLMLTTGS